MIASIGDFTRSWLSKKTILVYPIDDPQWGLYLIAIALGWCEMIPTAVIGVTGLPQFLWLKITTSGFVQKRRHSKSQHVNYKLWINHLFPTRRNIWLHIHIHLLYTPAMLFIYLYTHTHHFVRQFLNVCLVFMAMPYVFCDVGRSTVNGLRLYIPIQCNWWVNPVSFLHIFTLTNIALENLHLNNWQFNLFGGLEHLFFIIYGIPTD